MLGQDAALLLGAGAASMGRRSYFFFMGLEQLEPCVAVTGFGAVILLSKWKFSSWLLAVSALEEAEWERKKNIPAVANCKSDFCFSEP